MTNDDHNKPQDKAIKSSSEKKSNPDKSIKKAKRIDKDVQRLQAKALRDVKVEGLKNQDLVADKSHQQLLGEQQAIEKEGYVTQETTDKSLITQEPDKIANKPDVEGRQTASKLSDAQSPAADQLAGAALELNEPDRKAAVQAHRVGQGGGLSEQGSSYWYSPSSLIKHVTPHVTADHQATLSASLPVHPSLSVNQNSNFPETGAPLPPVLHAEGKQQQSGSVKEDSVSEVSGNLHVLGSGSSAAVWSVESGAGIYGQLSVDPNTGEWRYRLDNSLSSTNALAEGEHHTEQFVVLVKDSSQNQVKMVVSVEVEGSNDRPIVSGLHHANVTDMAKLSDVGGQLLATDPDHNEHLLWAISDAQGQFGRLTINTDTGQWQYHLDNQRPATQSLSNGHQAVEHFIVTVTDSSGNAVKQDLSVQVIGTNEQAVIGGGYSGVLTEDQDLHQGQLHAGGMLTVTDVDAGENRFQAGVLQGQFGTLSINNLGHWTYTADNSQAAIQGLRSGESLTDTLVVHSVDGTEQKITVTINGTDDKAVIAGTSTAQLTEDKDLHQGQLHVDGALTVTDVDNGQNQFQANVLQGQFGTLSINNLGHWTYTADNSQQAIQGLKTGESLTDTLVVHSVDGTEQKITVSINGTDDKAVIGGTSTASLTEDKDLHQGQLHVDGALTVTDVDNGQNQFQANVLQGQFGTLSINNLGHWTYTADNSQQAIQGLKTGESLTDTLVVHSVDGTEQKITVTINGTDDKAVIAGTSTAQLTEDKDLHQGQLHADGVLNVTDVDNGQNQLQAGVLQGQFGTLSINNLGHWTYTADNSQQAIQGLKSGESLTDTLIVHSVDGTEQKITVSIDGTDDKAVIAGTSTAQLTEDKDLHQGQLHVHGTLTVTDIDHGQNQFQAGVLHGQFGTLSINNLGHWIYTADNSQQAIQGLKTSESLTDTLVVHSIDGTAQKVMVSINGSDDKAVIAGTSTVSLTEDKDLHQGQLHADGVLTVTDVDAGQNQFQAGIQQGQFGSLSINELGHWTYTADNSQPVIQGLKTGESLTDTLVVHSIDGTEQKITVSINGTDDKAVIAGTSTAQLTEDKDLNQGQLHADGTITVTDIDSGENQFQAEVQQGQFGSLSINELGHWTYTADNSQQAIQGLKTGESLTDTLVVHSVDGTEQKITVSINGTDDKAVIKEVNTGTVTEDGSHSSYHNGQTTELASGSLQVIDPDSGEDKFRYSQFGETAVKDQFNGQLRIDSAGNWGYSVDNSRLQHLAVGQIEEVVYRVHSQDGTAYELHIQVEGTNDAPVANIVTLTSGTEDTHYQMQASQFGFTDIDTGDTLHSIAITDLPPTTEGKFVLDGHDIAAGQSIATADISKLQFVPAKDFNGDVQFKYTVNDGHVDSAKASNTLHITATDDASVISGDTQGSVNEANIGDTTTATGQLTITDVDAGQNPSFADVTSTATTYGHIEMHNGQWTYTLDQSKVQQLDPEQAAVVDHHTFTASDGSTQVVDITISGTNDRPIIESAHAAPVGSSSTLKLQDVDIVSNPTGANIDVAATNGENVARWGTDITGVASGVKLVGLYKPGSDHNWITTPATTSTPHSGAGGYNRVDNHDWWHANGIPDTVNTGSGGASGHGNVWSGGIVVFEDALGHQTIGIINRVCTGGGGEVDYLYYHAYQNLQVGSTAYSGTAAAGETITVMDGANKIASVVADIHGHWQVAANHLADGLHTLHVENSAGQHSAETVFQVSGNTMSNITPAGLDAELKEDAAQITIDGELRTSDIDSGDSASFNAQAQHTTQYGHFSLDANGKYHYTIDNTNQNVNQLGVNQTLTEVIPVTSTSTDGSTVTNNITITIHGSVDHPSLSASAPDAQQGAVMDLNLNVATTDTGGDTESLLIKISGLPDHAILNHGTYDNIAKMWVLDKTDLTGLTLDLKDPHFHGDLLINVTATASAGGESQSTTQPVTIFVNQPPQVSAPVTGSKTEDSGMGPINLLQGATDADSGDILSIADIQYQIGTAGQSANKPDFLTLGKDGHTLVINANAAEFQHLAAGENETITVSYNIKDSHGGQLAQTATITVTGTDDTAQISGHISTDERTHMTEDVRVQPHGHILSSDKMTLQVTDPDSSENYFIPTGATGTTDAHSNGAWVNGDNSVGQFILHASGEWYFKADNNSTIINSLGEGEKITDTITVQSAGGTTQQLTAVVYGTNDAPTISTEAVLTSGVEDSNLIITSKELLANASDIDHNDQNLLTIENLQVNHGSLIDNSDGTYTFTPDKNYNGQVHFTYDVQDAHGGIAHTGATTTLAEVNDAPTVTATTTAAVDLGTTAEDTAINFTDAQLLQFVGAQDVDTGDSLTISAITIDPTLGVFAKQTDGSWLFTPAKDVSGSNIALTLQVSDGTTTTTAHGTIGITAVADSPVSSMAESVHTDFSSPDIDPLHQHGGTWGLTDPTAWGWQTDNTDGKVEHGRGSAYGDSSGGNVGVVELEAGANDASNLYRIIHTQAGAEYHLEFDLSGRVGITSDSAAVEVLWEGKVIDTLKPAANTFGFVNHSYDLVATGDNSRIELRAVTHDGSGPVIDNLELGFGGLSGTEDTDLPIKLNLHLTDTDGSEIPSASFKGLPIGFTVTDGTHSETVQTLGQEIDADCWDLDHLVVKPAANFNGDVDIVVSARSVETSNHDTASTDYPIRLHFTPVDDVPTLQSGSENTHEDAAVITGQMLATDPDTGDVLSFSSNVPVAGFSINSNGSYQFDPSHADYQSLADGQGKTITIGITVTDAAGHTDTQDLVISMTGTNDAPTVTTQAISANEDSDYQFTLANFGFTDVDSHDSLDHITINSLPDPAEGVLLINGVAVSAKQQISAADISHLTFKPALNFNGDVQFNYSVNDGHVDSASANATLTVTNVNDIPTVTATTAQTSEDISGGLLISKTQLLMGANDIDGDSLDITSVSVPTSQGSVTDNHDGTWTFNPAHDFKGDATLSYKVSDGSAQVDNHMTVAVSPVTDKASVQLSLTTEQHVMQFATHDAGGVTNNGELQTHGDISNLAVEFNIIGGPTAPPAGHNGPTLVSYGTSHSDNEFYVWDPTNLTIRINTVEYKTGVSATDGLTHRYSVLWSSATGHLELLVDGESKWVNPTPVAKGYQIPGNGVLAIGNDQDTYQIETGSHTNHGFSVNDAFSGQMFSATLATTTVTAGQLKNAPLSSVVDKNHGLVIDMRMNAHGDFVDTTGHHQVTPTANVHSQTSMVDTSVAIPNADALVHLNLLVTAPTDSSDVITKTVITGLIKGTVLDDGHGHSHTITGMVEQVDIQHWNLASLTAQLPGSDTQNMNIGLIVTTQGPDGATATNSHYQHLVLDPTKPIPDAVIGGDIQGNTDEVTAITGQLTITDTDPSQAHFIAQVIPTTHGEFTINESGHWSFTPNSTAQTLTQGSNATEIVTVKTVDGTEQQLSVTLVGSDTAPTSVVADLGLAEPGRPHLIQTAELLANVTDIDTLASGLSIVDNSLTSPHGTFTSNADGSFNFVANAGFVGNDLAINFKVTDGHNQVDAKAIIDVVPPLAITRLGNDTGVSDSDFFTSDGHLVVYGTGEPGAQIMGSGILGGLKTTVDQDGNWQLDASSKDQADGTLPLIVFEVKPDGSFNQVKHTVTIDTAKPTIAIDPISNDDWVNHNEHLQALTISGSCTHVADGDNVDITLAGQHYFAVVNNNHWQVVVPAAETASISDNGYQVHAEVAATATGDTASIDRNIIVSADLSTLVQTAATAEDTKTAGSGSLFAIGGANTVTSTGVLHGNYGSLQMNADGSYQYTLNNHSSDIQQMSQVQNLADNFFVTYTNPHGDVKHAVLNVGIHGTNDAPVLTGTFEISRSVTTGAMTKTHSYGYINIEELDKGDTLTYEYIDSHGATHALDFSAGNSNKINVAGIGYFNIDADGRWDFTLSNSGPERDNMNQEIASGKIHTESVQLKVTDSAGASREETLSVHIGDGKTGPQIFGASESVVTEDKVTQSHGLLDLLVNDVKVANGVTWSLQSGSQPQYGNLTLAADGSWQYQAHNNAAKVQALAEGERLEETIMVTATDEHGHSVDQAMKLVIIGTNDVPVVAHALSSKVIEDHLLTLDKTDLLANVEDKDDIDKLDVSQLQLIGGGSIIQQGDHWIINPGVNFNGNLRLTYQVSDGHVAIDNAMSIHVSPDADTPTMIFTKHVGDLSSPLDSFAIQGNENTDLALNINVASPDGNETLSVEISGLPSGASLSAGSEHNGIWTLQQNELTNLKVIPESDFHGHFDLSVTATSHDASEQASVSQAIGVDVLAAPAQFAGIGQSDAPQSDTETDTITFSSSIDSDLSDAVSTGVISDPIAPVDHYFQMLGMSRDDAPSESLVGSQTDLLPEFNVDNPLADEDNLVGQSPDPFDNPLAEGEDQDHQLDDVQDHGHSQLVDDNTAMDSHDDELLHSALNNMHNQW
ncbi:VCBS domain-containing protein [Agarivorans aestuarii]|uniref:VCBS domain-containing protein n=1 Tax=Agarivorans aestuarii TaxID=1563703 RepID=A0ABU7G6A5_9ALTE|nr:VCBS domain-containing protein [Agarivorans aestuarii]MEE1674786.1 VCBS domain-containing protein [Agarivorans aestuarii]